MRLLNSKSDYQIKSDIKRFIDGDYLGHFTKEEHDFGLRISFLFNHSKIEDNFLIFTYDQTSIKIKIDPTLPNVREAHFSFIMNNESFELSLKSYIRDHKINEIINHD